MLRMCKLYVGDYMDRRRAYIGTCLQSKPSWTTLPLLRTEGLFKRLGNWTSCCDGVDWLSKRQSPEVLH